MFRNYFKTAFRNLWRNKVFSSIKILGLSIGLTVCMLIFLYTKDEISYDRFHKNQPQLFRVIQTVQINNDPAHTMGITNGSIGEAFTREIPGVLQSVRLNGESVTLKAKNNDVTTEKALYVDDNFFNVFTFPLIEGDKRTALKDPYSIVLSGDMAKKYFGTEDAVGEILQIKKFGEFENYTVTAIAENAPQNSSIRGDLFFKIQTKVREGGHEWFGGNLNTFLLLSPGADLKTIEAKMQALYVKNTTELVAKTEKEQGVKLKGSLNLQPLTDIHFGKKAGPDNGMVGGSKPGYSYVLTCIAVFILIIACINFINLAVAQSLKRGKEIGIRKVVGGTRGQLIRQFLAESFVVSLLAFGIAIFLTVILLPFFNQLANKKLSLSYLSDGYLYAGYFLLLLVTSFIAGFYPSLVLSSFQPVKVLYNRQRMMSRNLLTKGLIVLQFSLAIFLMIGTVAVNRQVNYLLTKDLGYESENLIQVKLPFGNSGDKLAQLFKNELAGHKEILSVSARHAGRHISGVKVSEKMLTIEENKIDENYLQALKIPILAGRNFSTANAADTIDNVIVNETFVREAGWKLNDAVGQAIHMMDAKNTPATIVGVVKDYHFTSLKEKITPALFNMNPREPYGEVWVKISPDNVPQTLALLETTFRKLVPFYPYSYNFMDDINATNYESEAKWKQIVGIASLLFVFISCIGLLGLVIISIEQRTKEIGIRKVLGAAAARIVLLISREFILLISIAFVVAIPLGYYFISKWLEDFVYRINIGWWMFALAGALILVTALLTIGFKAIRAALANPVKSLRTE